MMKSGQKRPKVVVIVGPTGVGKTALSINLAKRFRGEIISADSRQVYNGLNIGTEKISKKEMRGIPHHLIDVASPKKVFTADDFRMLGQKAIHDITSRNYLPIVVGGTGFYISSLLDGNAVPRIPADPKLRKLLEKLSAEKLFVILKKKDPRRAKSIDAKNPRRLIRALEIIKALGKVPKLKPNQLLYDTLWIGILPGKKYEKNLEHRLEKQLNRGLIREIKTLLKSGVPKKRMHELGLEYRTGLEYLEGKISKTDMKIKMLAKLRQYSKRQMTWFKPNEKITWHNSSSTQRLTQDVKNFLKSSG